MCSWTFVILNQQTSSEEKDWCSWTRCY